MTAGAVLTIIGGSLQLAGLAVAGFGVRRTRLEYGQERLGTWGQAKDRIFQPLPPVTGTATMVISADAAGAAFNATVVAAPAPDATAAEREQFLLERVIWLQAEAGRLRESVAHEGRERRTAVDRLRGTMNERADQLRRGIDSAMADGLAQEALGLWLAAVGAVLAIIGAAV
ncbi:hypothetical protein QFZ55_000010 [Streptomyces luteogriseus]|uniref:hypothetical protein n=1 Tax=Streptomyces luteogriseus TaxID=68233 RepID=UPI002780660C|nr:hypothetical protein [Streptomyces luteogriseus]MDQ0710558.1 hypothetical protein [Streptomyces luteogriseus]